jgi:CDGSH-type Zn-finger protein
MATEALDDSGPRIRITRDGPYLASGDVPLVAADIVAGADGIADHWGPETPVPARERYALCRCGQSRHKPFCDGTHHQVKFDGTETADRTPFADQAESTVGPGLVLLDAPKLCAHAGFCEKAGGTWGLVERSDDPSARALAVQAVHDCPAGRLVVKDGAGRVLEAGLRPSIVVVEDPHENASGPLWIRGNIPVESADGSVYEVRNRVTLCRCGRSAIKPLCDGAHLDVPGSPAV